MDHKKKSKVNVTKPRLTSALVFICIFVLAMVFSIKLAFFTEHPLFVTKDLLNITQSDNANVEEVVRLIKEGADVNAVNKTGSTPLILAAQYSSNPDILQALIDNGASIDIQDKKGKRAIDYAEQNEALAGTSVLSLLK